MIIIKTLRRKSKALDLSLVEHHMLYQLFVIEYPRYLQNVFDWLSSFQIISMAIL